MEPGKAAGEVVELACFVRLEVAPREKDASTAQYSTHWPEYTTIVLHLQGDVALYKVGAYIGAKDVCDEACVGHDCRSDWLACILHEAE